MNETTLVPESGFFRFRVDLSYDGTNFSGWGKQPDRRTVQGEVEAALTQIFDRQIYTTVAGRTDAGVHATGQVIHFDAPIKLDEMIYRLNRILTDEIRIINFNEAPHGFHARFSALRRNYIYKILDGNQTLHPVLRTDVAPYYRKLNINLMNEAAETLLGENDFFSFCRFREKATTVRKLEKFEFHRRENGVIVGEVSADAFCYSMVRGLVGAVVHVGEERFPVSWAREVLEKRERQSESLVFPAKGLTLVGVDYPEDAKLLERANLTMAHRSSAEED
ncbi:MAG: hypothetical protein RLZ57_658 [Actinomycetota bacterium]|jgi:tRNA pseudouridine38-40 synthase